MRGADECDFHVRIDCAHGIGDRNGREDVASRSSGREQHFFNFSHIFQTLVLDVGAHRALRCVS